MTHHDPLLLLVQGYGELPYTSIYPEMIFETFNNDVAQVVTLSIKWVDSFFPALRS